MSTFRSFVIKENNGAIVKDVILENTENLPAGDVLIKVMYSTINSYDVLFSRENTSFRKNTYPYVPGVDAAGIVVESNSTHYREGDEVLIFGNGLGQDVHGGFGQFVRVPESWIVSLPTGLSMQDSMTLGSDGIAAAISVMEIMAAGIQTNSKEVIVGGSSYGIGAFAVSILALCGYNVTAVTKYMECEDFIYELGAKEVLSIDNFTDNSGKHLLEDKYVAGIDTLGGDVLDTMIRSVKGGSTIAVCGAVLSETFSSSLLPLILRGINLVGIDSLRCSHSLKREALYRLAGDWYLKTLSFMCNEISIFEINEYLDKMNNNLIKGRIVVNHKL